MTEQAAISLPDYGETIGLYGDTGSGKTTQAGELAKRKWKLERKRTRLNAADLGNYGSLKPLIKKGIMELNEFDPSSHDPWIWTDDICSGKDLADDIGLVINDSATSISEALLTACHKSTTQIGQQKTQKFSVSQGKSRTLQVSINNEAHYGVVQGFMLDEIWKATWLTRRKIDVLWTFGVLRSEDQNLTQVLAPLLAGKALSPKIPKWFKYFFYLQQRPQVDAAPIHRLYLTAHPELGGAGHCFGNSRYPLGATPLPPYIEPASLTEALDLIEAGQAEADRLLEEEIN